MLEGAKGRPKDNAVGYVDTLLEYYLGINPKELSDEAWAEKFAQLKDIRKAEGKEINLNF